MTRTLLLLVFFVSLPILAVGADTLPVAKQITLSVDADLVEFVKASIWIGGIFLAVYALVGVMFFGWDVAKARGSITTAQTEVKGLLKELRDDYAGLKNLKERLEELGAALQEDIEASERQRDKTRHRFRDDQGTRLEASIIAPEAPPTDTRTNIERIRDVIRTSRFEWTTIGRIMDRTGLPRDNILDEVRMAGDIVATIGSQTGDYLFKLDPMHWARDHEWWSDPKGTALKEAQKALEEFREERKKKDAAGRDKPRS